MLNSQIVQLTQLAARRLYCTTSKTLFLTGSVNDSISSQNIFIY